MKIQRFEASSAQAALAQAQEALGEDAVILQTRTVKAPGMLTRSRVEVIAAVDTPLSGLRPTENESSIFKVAPSGQSDWQEELAGLRQEMRELRECMARYGGGKPASLSPSKLAARLRRELQTSAIQLQQGGATLVALVGPSGVGKTTTLAKIAAACCLEGKRVAILSVDVFRIGAPEQINAIARLLEVPLVCVHSLEESREACARFLGYDLVLIDTIGCSATDTELLEEQAAYLEFIGVDEVHLCLSSSDSEATLQRNLKGFSLLRPTQVLFTRLDETASFDIAMSVALDAELPVSYVSTGQQIPEDLSLAQPAALADRLMEGEAL